MINNQQSYQSLKKGLLLLFVLLVSKLALAHATNFALANAPEGEIITYYGSLGFRHIVPGGLDHILFVVAICLLNTNIKTIIWQATSFTIAHSITLALSMKNIIVAPPSIVEPIIALSIAFVAIENLFLDTLKPWRIAIVFLFGLIHGMGFASALNEIGLPPGKFISSILYFNLGVEMGQISVILTTYFLIMFPFKNKSWYKKGIVFPLSIAISLVSMYWVVERLKQ